VQFSLAAVLGKRRVVDYWKSNLCRSQGSHWRFSSHAYCCQKHRR